MPELIDRAKLLEYLAAIKPDEYVSAYGEAAVDVINHVETYVSGMPTIEAEPARHGRWVVHTTWRGMFGLIHSECSDCKFDRNGDLSSWKFCPNCCARIDLRTPTEAQLDEADSVMMGGADND